MLESNQRHIDCSMNLLYGSTRRENNLLNKTKLIKIAFINKICCNRLNGGPDEIQTHDFYLARVALYQLSYKPKNSPCAFNRL